MPSNISLWYCVLPLAVCSCSTPTCEDVVFRMVAHSHDCGLETGIGEAAGAPCSDRELHKLECDLACFEDASCEAIRSEDPSGAAELQACWEYCHSMWDVALQQ